MTTFQTISHRKQSFAATSLLFLILFLLLMFFKFNTKIDIMQLEGGGGGGNIAVNFGDSDTGMGNNFEETKPAAASSTQKVKVADAQEALITNSSDDDVAVVSEVKKPKSEPKKPIEKPIDKPKPKVSKSASDALSNILNSSAKSGDGDDKVGGNKGKSSGNTSATGYNGGGGSGTGTGGGSGSGQGIGTGTGYGSGSGSGRGSGAGNYQLLGRKALSKPNPKYNCNEQGVVVVQISVNAAGQVTEAIAGIKGTTNTAKCLTEQAKIAAQNTKFDANEDAPEKQVGKIIYNFKLSQ